MTKEPDKYAWETNYHNKSISGIEVKDKNGRVVHFIAIYHNETLHDIKQHRVTIRLDENGQPMLPPPQTFEEIIQAKRRQQMLLYGSGATSTNTTTNQTTNGTNAARRAAAATKRAKANLNRRSVPTIPAPQPAPSSTRRSVPGGDSKRSHSKKKASKATPRQRPQPASKVQLSENTLADSFQCEESLANTSFDAHTNSTVSDTISVVEQPIPSSSAKPVVTSMKDLNKNNPLLSSMDPKEVKQMVRSAPPGTSIVLPNGTVIRKSRRGGARAGAGRKRSRPLPPSQNSSSRNSTANGNSSMQVGSTESSPNHNKLLN